MFLFVCLVFTILITGFHWSSLIYNMSARHEWHKCDSSNTSATGVRHGQHECDTSAARVLHKRHEYDMSEKFFILITTRVKTYFQTSIFTLRQVKNYKERNNFILRTNFWKCLIPMPKSIWKVHHKDWTF